MTTLLNQVVTLTLPCGTTFRGLLTFAGVAPIHQHFGSAITTFTVGRFPVTVESNLIHLVTVELFNPLNLF